MGNSGTIQNDRGRQDRGRQLATVLKQAALVMTDAPERDLRVFFRNPHHYKRHSPARVQVLDQPNQPKRGFRDFVNALAAPVMKSQKPALSIGQISFPQGFDRPQTHLEFRCYLCVGVIGLFHGNRFVSDVQCLGLSHNLLVNLMCC